MILKNTDIFTLANEINSGRKRLVCFGAGGLLREIFERDAQVRLQDLTYKILDNRAETFSYNGGEMPVYSVERFLADEARVDDIVVLITTMAYPEVFEQLDRVARLRDCECYVHLFVRNVPPPYDLPEPVGTPKIPKKIHYVWFGGKEIPRQNRIWMESWQKYCPGYEIVRHDETNYDVSKNRYMREAYQAKKYAFASDYARLDVIYEHGGVYLDNDVELLQNLDRLLYDEAFFAAVGPPNIINTGQGFGAVRGCGIVKEMRDYYDGQVFVRADGTYNYANANNNILQTHVLLRYGMRDENALQFVSGANARIYPSDVFNPKDHLGNPSAFTKNTLGIHHYARSWFDEGDMVSRDEDLRKYNKFWHKHFI